MKDNNIQTDVKISTEFNGWRLDQIAHHLLHNISRSQWQKYGVFKKENTNYPAKTKAKNGEYWIITYQPNNFKNTAAAWDFPLEIIYESKTWLALNKPIGISVHDSVSENSGKTIVNALVSHFGKENLAVSEAKIDGKVISRPGLIHRLDKTTSGVLLIAKSNKTQKYFQDHWQAVQKYYQAIVTGTTPKLGRITADITRDPDNRKRMQVTTSGNGRSAHTEFKTLMTRNSKSLLEIQIFTGRTHQIRVHLSSINHPIFGDLAYGGSKSDRVYLHAQKLRFPDPDKNGEISEIKCESGFSI